MVKASNYFLIRLSILGKMLKSIQTNLLCMSNEIILGHKRNDCSEKELAENLRYFVEFFRVALMK